MGLDLTLCPVDHFAGNSGDCRSSLRLPGGYAIAEAFEARRIKPDPIPARAEIWGDIAGRVPDGAMRGERMYGRFERTPYGNRYTWIDAGTLAPILASVYPGHPATAYVAALPGETMIVLGWH